jgi:hypothetical protein
MVGVIMDAILMLLLVAAVAYGIRLERKLAQLRAGQAAFAGAVSELNEAASRAEAALASLRASGGETDLLHDRILKARQVKTELEALIARGDALPVRAATPALPPVAIEPAAEADEAEAERARRMAALAQRIQGLGAKPAVASSRADNGVGAILQALSANQTAKDSLNRARRSLDDDLFAA